MQLSPRQYQVDPTGSAYVQDTRPLMAAMGAQAASQIESNRMMTETMQKGMQGIEDFAARRQLAAARAQLGALNIEDESYGQKLSELVMDNPLAFTNRKTAAVANMAFKQAGEDFRNKREYEQRLALQAREFDYGRDQASMSQYNQMAMANIARSAEIQAQIFSQESKNLSQERDAVLEALKKTVNPEMQQLLREKLQGIDARSNQLSRQLESKTVSPDIIPFSSIDTAPPPLPTESPAQNVAPMGSAGNGIPLPLAAEGKDDFYNPLIMGLGDGGSFGAPSVIQAAPVPEFTAEDGLPPAPAATAPAAPAAPAATVSAANIPFTPNYGFPPDPTASGIPEAPVLPPTGRVGYGLTPEKQQRLDILSAQAIKEEEDKKNKQTMSGAEFQDQQNFTEDLVTNDPEVGKLMSEVSALTNESKALETLISSNKLVPNAEQNAQFLTSQRNLTQKANELNQLRAAKRLEIRNAGGAAQYQIKKAKQEQERLDAAVKAQKDPATAAANARLASAMAGTPAAAAGAATTPATPKPPAPPISADPFEQVAIDRELKRKEEQGLLALKTNKQWTDTKQKITNILGGPQELMKIADEVFENNVFGISLPADETRLRVQLKLKIINKAGNIVGFNQKAERLGLQTVSRSEIIEALVDDIIKARQSGIAKANAPTAPVESKLKEPGTYTTSK